MTQEKHLTISGDDPGAAWTSLANLAFSGDFDKIDELLHPQTKTLACGVVQGLFGIDCDHGCRSEVHPVYAMAVRLNEDLNHNQWMVLVRNWGNGGSCSGYNDQLTASQMSVVLPVISPAGPPEKISAEQFAGTAGVDCPTPGYDPNEGEKLLFDLPAPQQQAMAVMIVKITWRPAHRPCSAIRSTLPICGSCETK